jgi:hypothetical protein
MPVAQSERTANVAGPAFSAIDAGVAEWRAQDIKLPAVCRSREQQMLNGKSPRRGSRRVQGRRLGHGYFTVNWLIYRCRAGNDSHSRDQYSDLITGGGADGRRSFRRTELFLDHDGYRDGT